MRDRFTGRVVELARDALKGGSFPNGALVVSKCAGTEWVQLAESISLSEQRPDPTAHAEVVAIRRACRTKNSNSLSGCVLYTSLEPCLMCLHAAYWAGIRKIIYCCPRDRVAPECFEGNMDANQASKFLRESMELSPEYSTIEEVVSLHYIFRSQSS